MTWDDVDNILWNGTKEEIENVKCPECNKKFEMSYYPKTRNTQIWCNNCGTLIRGHGSHSVPNFYTFGFSK